MEETVSHSESCCRPDLLPPSRKISGFFILFSSLVFSIILFSCLYSAVYYLIPLNQSQHLLTRTYSLNYLTVKCVIVFFIIYPQTYSYGWKWQQKCTDLVTSDFLVMQINCQLSLRKWLLWLLLLWFGLFQQYSLFCPRILFVFPPKWAILHHPYVMKTTVFYGTGSTWRKKDHILF